MSSRTCPDWPELMELEPDLQFKHYTVAEAHLPPEAFVHAKGVGPETVAICCDLEHHVYNLAHTEPDVAAGLRDTHWYELHEWLRTGPGARTT
jgi:hypothetical protein